MKLIILAAGKGTRFYPLTQNTPKGLIRLLGRPLLEHVLDAYLDTVSEIIFVINDQTGSMIQDHFGTKYQGHAISYIIQAEQDSRGTLGALSLCKDAIGENIFCVSNCDDLVLKEDVENAIKQNISGIGLSKASMPWYYLSIDTDENNFVTGFRRHVKEDGAIIQDDFSNGFYMLTPEIFDMEPVLTRDGEMGLPQTLFANLEKYPLKVFGFKKWQSVNGPEDMAGAEAFVSELL
ncbi:NTP transferase domain-containing protein [Candidatus Parcubacteria bacterium]|nr:NTP transferase domain-containing protein [Candidatus Parcubacteria bacterium]